MVVVALSMGLTYVEAANPSVTSYLPMIAFYTVRLSEVTTLMHILYTYEAA
jgi:hypothetical protein